MNDEFQGYEVDPADAGYESVYDDEGRYIPDEEDVAEGFAEDPLEDPLEPYYDEYGDLDPDALERLRGKVIETTENQAAIAHAQETRQLEQIYRELEQVYPSLATDRGALECWHEACRLYNVDPNDQQAFDEFLHSPDVVAEAAESMNGGAGQFHRMHAGAQDPEMSFWGVDGSGGGVG